MPHPIQHKTLEERDRLVLANLGIARRVGSSWFLSSPMIHQFATMEDFVQAAMVALIEAADNFDVRLGIKFSTYSYNCVSLKMINFVKGQSIIRVPLSADSKTRTDRIRRVIPLLSVKDNDNGFDVPDERDLSDMDDKIQLEHVRKTLPRLPEREREIIHRRFLSRSPQTLVEAGKDLGMCKQKVLQIQQRAIKRLKAYL